MSTPKLPAERLGKADLRTRLTATSAAGKELNVEDAALVEKVKVLRALRTAGKSFVECSREMGLSDTRLKVLQHSHDYATVCEWLDGRVREDKKADARQAVADARVEIALMAGQEVAPYYRLCLTKAQDGTYLDPGLAQWAIEKLAKAAALDVPVDQQTAAPPISGNIINVFLNTVKEDDDENERMAAAFDVDAIEVESSQLPAVIPAPTGGSAA